MCKTVWSKSFSAEISLKTHHHRVTFFLFLLIEAAVVCLFSLLKYNIFFFIIVASLVFMSLLLLLFPVLFLGHQVEVLCHKCPEYFSDILSSSVVDGSGVIGGLVPHLREWGRYQMKNWDT